MGFLSFGGSGIQTDSEAGLLRPAFDGDDFALMGADGSLFRQIRTATSKNYHSALNPHALHPNGFISFLLSASLEDFHPFADAKMSCSGCGYAIFHGVGLPDNSE